VLTLPRSTAEITPTIEIDAPLIAPLQAGDVVGRVVLTRAGETVGEAPLEVLEAAEPAGFFSRLWDTIVLWFQQLLG
jgi:D-alanyl-D-alanine carboxypeptidase (penicillin-binding protein 5/6)